MIKVLLADDHAVFREGLRALLEARDDLQVVGEAGNGRAAIDCAGQLHPDVILMDIAMPELNGIEATQEVCRRYPDARVIILSMLSSSEHVYRAFKAGARGYLLKDAAARSVVDAIRAVYRGAQYLGEKIANPFARDPARDRQSASPLDSLSRREREVLQLLAEGRSNPEVGRQLALSPRTVETYRSRLMQKLGLTDLPSLVKFAIQHGVIPLS